MRYYLPAILLLVVRGSAQSSGERWNLYGQATSIGQYHRAFEAPYSGPESLAAHREAEVSLTTTAFLGLRLLPNTQLYFDPEVAGGRGFSGVTGMANAPTESCRAWRARGRRLRTSPLSGHRAAALVGLGGSGATG